MQADVLCLNVISLYIYLAPFGALMTFLTFAMTCAEADLAVGQSVIS